MSVLEHPTAQALLDQATLEPQQVTGLARRLEHFLSRYLPRFARAEQRTNATLILQGQLSSLQRKTTEPIANQAGVHRKPLQNFVGAAAWDDDGLLAELRDHVRQAWPDPDAVLTFDSSGFPKKGLHSCGVQRQYCGRLGKVENCQVGVFASYACRYGHTLVDRRLFLPKAWACDKARRRQTHVPKGTRYREPWQLALDLLRRRGDLPHAWVSADSELGRCARFRARLRRLRERYLVRVRADTWVRDLDAEPPPRRGSTGRRRRVPFVRADAWARAQPSARWQRLTIRAGEKGPLAVKALTAPVQTRQDNRIGPHERLLVVRSLGPEAKTWYELSNAPAAVPLAELVRAHGEHHRVEESLQEGKGEVGLGHYEVRSWVGWHHHMTLSLLALWFLALEQSRLGEKKTGADGAATAGGAGAAAAAAAAEPRGDRRRDQPRAAA
jgi:SRSO17 transposase